MNQYTSPYRINPTYASLYWKTEHTSNFIPKFEIKKKKKFSQKSIQIKIPFSTYKI